MTIGLIRTEAASDLRTLTATGATSTTRRTLTATTGGALALLGALTGATGAYLALAAGYRSDPSVLSHPPVLYLTITIVGIPAAAALSGWLLARPPASSPRPPRTRMTHPGRKDHNPGRTEPCKTTHRSS